MDARHGERRLQGRIVRRVLTGVVYVWTVALVLQHFGIFMWARDEIHARGDPGGALTLFAVSAIVKIALLIIAMLIQHKLRDVYSYAICGAVILYASPLGLYVDPFLLVAGHHPSLSTLLTLGAAISYLVVAALAVLCWTSRRRVAREAAQAEAL